MEADLQDMGVGPVLKPFDIDDLLHTIQRTLAAGTGTTASRGMDSGLNGDLETPA